MEHKVSQILKIGTLVISIISLIMFVIMSGQETPKVSGMLSISYVLFFIAAAAAILFSVINLVSDIKNAMTSLIGGAALVLIIGISYSMASDDVINNTVVEGSRWAETGLISVYILSAVAVLAIIAGSVKKLIS
jgi:hypothetical protein